MVKNIKERMVFFYWRKLKQRLKEEGNETVTNCHALKMTAKECWESGVV